MISPVVNSIDNNGMINGNRSNGHQNNHDNGNDDNGENKIMKHEKFIEALEKFGGGTDGNEWRNMATYLDMSVWDVKLYAYSYMHQLCESDNDDDDDDDNTNGNAPYSAESAMESESLEDEDNSSILSRQQQQQPALIPPDNNSMSDGYLPYEDNVEWTCDEAILFDNLLALYLPTKSDEAISKWEKISGLMPNKNSIQCRNRYYSHIHNKI